MVNNSFNSKSIAYSGLLVAVLIGGKYVLSFIPNVEIVSSLIILSTIFFGGIVSIPGTIAFVVLDPFIYGFNPLVLIQYVIHFPTLAIVVTLVKKRYNKLIDCLIVSSIFSILFWIETPIINEIAKLSLFIPTLVSGIPFMITQLLSSLAFIAILYKPMEMLSLKINN